MHHARAVQEGKGVGNVQSDAVTPAVRRKQETQQEPDAAGEALPALAALLRRAKHVHAQGMPDKQLQLPAHRAAQRSSSLRSGLCSAANRLPPGMYCITRSSSWPCRAVQGSCQASSVERRQAACCR